MKSRAEMIAAANEAVQALVLEHDARILVAALLMRGGLLCQCLIATGVWAAKDVTDALDAARELALAPLGRDPIVYVPGAPSSGKLN